MVMNSHGYVSVLIQIQRRQQSSQDQGFNVGKIKLAQLVYLNRQDLRSDSPHQMKTIAGPSSQDGGGPSEY